MPLLLDRHWFLTWTTYGTWLPGDRRGFVGPIETAHGTIEVHNIPGEPYDRDLPDLEFAARAAMKGPAVWLDRDQAVAVRDQILETAGHRGWRVLAVSIMSNHCHAIVTVPGDSDPSKLLGDFKAYASRRLSRLWTKPAGGTWWTEHGSKRRRRTEASVRAAVHYTLDQHGMLAWSVDPNVPAEWLPRERGA